MRGVLFPLGAATARLMTDDSPPHAHTVDCTIYPILSNILMTDCVEGEGDFGSSPSPNPCLRRGKLVSLRERGYWYPRPLSAQGQALITPILGHLTPAIARGRLFPRRGGRDYIVGGRDLVVRGLSSRFGRSGWGCGGSGRCDGSGIRGSVPCRLRLCRPSAGRSIS